MFINSNLICHDDYFVVFIFVKLLKSLDCLLVVQQFPVVLIDGEDFAGLGGDQGAVHVEAGDLGPRFTITVRHDQQPAGVSFLPSGCHLEKLI